MYSLREKENVINKIRGGFNIDEIVLATGISRSTILKWKKELEIRRYIRKLINSGNFEEAKKEVEKITGKINEPIRNSILIEIARKEEDRETRKRLLDRQLELEPNNVRAISSKIGIAREEKDRETRKRLLDKLLELEPNNVKAIAGRIGIARDEEDTETEKRLLLKLDQNNEGTIKRKKRKTRYSKKRERES